MVNQRLKKFLDEITIEEIENCLRGSISSTLRFVKKKFFHDMKADKWTYKNLPPEVFKWVSEYFNIALKREWPDVLKGAVKELDSDIEALKADIRHHERQQKMHRSQKNQKIKEFELLAGRKWIRRLKED